MVLVVCMGSVKIFVGLTLLCFIYFLYLRKSRCLEHAEQTNQNWVCSFLLDCAAWKEYQIHRWSIYWENVTLTSEYLKSHFPLSFPLSRLWGRIHRNHIQRQRGGKEIPGILHKVSSCEIIPDIAKYEFMLFVLNFFHLFFFNRDEVVVAVASLMFDPVVSRVAELMAIGQIITKAQAQWVSCCIHTNWTTMCYMLHAHRIREIMLWRQMVYSQFLENLMACCGQKWCTSVNQNSKSKNVGCENQNNELKRH